MILTVKEIKMVYAIAIEMYKHNMATEGRSRTAEGIANNDLANYHNAIIEGNMVTGYYKNGCKKLPKFPKY